MVDSFLQEKHLMITIGIFFLIETQAISLIILCCYEST